MSDLKKEILEIIATITEKKADEILPDAHLVQEVGADSMMVLEVLASLEKKYKIIIPEDKLPEMTTLNKIVAIVEKAKKR